MPNLRGFFSFSNSDDRSNRHNLEAGLFQIASNTCNILVQVNSTNSYNFENTSVHFNNYHHGAGSPETTEAPAKYHQDHRNYNSQKTSTIMMTRNDDAEQSIVLLSSSRLSGADQLCQGEWKTNTAKSLLSSYRHRLSTVLEGSQTPAAGDDDVELWDQSQNSMFREESPQKWRNGSWCKPSCIPISIILILIVLVVLLPLLDHNDKASKLQSASVSLPQCESSCSIRIVESIPEGLEFSPGSPTFNSTFESWTRLIDLATTSIEIASFYWTMRGSDVYNHTSAWQGEKIFQSLLRTGQAGDVKITIAQSAPTQTNPNLDTELLVKRRAAVVRSVNMPRLIPDGGVLHTKLWIVDREHFYIGSANNDWRSLTQVKELGVLVENCSCLAKDVVKIFEQYFEMGTDNAQIPSKWPDKFSTEFNLNAPFQLNFSSSNLFNVFFSSSPPPFTATGRTNDLEAILHVILNAERYIHISVMDYFPLTIYTAKIRYWDEIDRALRRAAVENKVSVKLLISYWNHSRPAEDYFLKSLADLSNSFPGVNIQVKRFVIPASQDQANIPFARVNHAKYMVTDETAFITTSNWSGDYFTSTAGISLVVHDGVVNGGKSNKNSREDYDEKRTIRSDLNEVFERDWNSRYAVEMPN